MSWILRSLFSPTAVAALLSVFTFPASARVMRREPVDLRIEQVDVWPGKGSQILGPVDVEVRGGRIVYVGAPRKSEPREVIPGTGLTLIPGLMDMHVHLASVPGAFMRGETEEHLWETRRKQLRSFVALGVTTVLDAAIPTDVLLRLRADASRFGGPRILHLAPFLTPAGGYFTASNSRLLGFERLWNPVTNPGEIEPMVKAALAEKPVGMKVTVEDGFGPIAVWPLFTHEFRAAIRKASETYQLPVFTHNQTPKEHELALELKPRGFVHVGFTEKAATPALVKTIRDSGVFVTTTVSISRSLSYLWDPAETQEDWVKAVVPAAQLQTLLDPKIQQAVIDEAVAQSAPAWLPRFILRAFQGSFMNLKLIRGHLRNSQESARLLYEAGVPLVSGSDSGNWPILTSFLHGVGAIWELETLVEAGIPAAEALVSATSRAAQMVKLEQDLGTVEVGKVADLVLLRENPLQNIRTLRKPVWVIQGGVHRKALDWLESKPR